jgi:hypothetical protein
VYKGRTIEFQILSGSWAHGASQTIEIRNIQNPPLKGYMGFFTFLVYTKTASLEENIVARSYIQSSPTPLREIVQQGLKIDIDKAHVKIPSGCRENIVVSVPFPVIDDLTVSMTFTDTRVDGAAVLDPATAVVFGPGDTSKVI